MSSRTGLRMFSTNFKGNLLYFSTLKDVEADTREFCAKSKFTEASVCFEVREYELKNLTSQILMDLIEAFPDSGLVSKDGIKAVITENLIKSSRIWGHYVYVPATKIFAISKNNEKGNIPDADDKENVKIDDISDGPVPSDEDEVEDEFQETKPVKGELP
jgi:hypothetical protein